ncbi:hypothetical protein TSUD_280210 [Trifolium subterraneum]|uniref:Uncharacterized protein n=1 Tax=Trifolium subterraneum TaxID=3900 RepID=A0A2Z6N8F5_TRISU|nr:hypothetical protein TSUD_280210 [Trifolium subterraneum]
MSYIATVTAADEFGINLIYYQPLHSAILKGDWKSTKAFLDNDPSVLTAKITMFGGTALHVAAIGAQWKLVEKLVQLMPENMVTELDSKGLTCLHNVALSGSGSVDAAKALVAKNSSVTQVIDNNGCTPRYHCLSAGICKEMVWYLVSNTTDDRSISITKFIHLLENGFLDIAMYMLQRYPNFTVDSNGYNEHGTRILHVLTLYPSNFRSGHNFGFWKRCIYHCVPVELEYGNTIWNLLQTLVHHIWQQGMLLKLSLFQVQHFKCKENYSGLRCTGLVFINDFSVDVFSDPKCTLCRRRFSRCITSEINNRLGFSVLGNSDYNGSIWCSSIYVGT